MSIAMLRAVRVTPDGACRTLMVPQQEGPQRAALRDAVGGEPEHAHYGRIGGDAVCAVVHETGRLDGLPPNWLATAFIAQVRGGPLRYCLYGPVVLFGYDARPGRLTDLGDEDDAVLKTSPSDGAPTALHTRQRTTRFPPPGAPHARPEPHPRKT
ncbi:hypothetical protein ADK76_29085 [Streptomyces griseoflavus]|uniref:DUF3846 domain-containing protein n=1 Tax=Streptomyces rimosus TaxID=1927 RepID=UPI0004C9B003|nr:DUF3846 domain-containing protein [Streptomyces rimosus]KOG53163.1 hypothetical protein ADK76_29085 [Streptomyces griseoflavus]